MKSTDDSNQPAISKLIAAAITLTSSPY